MPTRGGMRRQHRASRRHRVLRRRRIQALLAVGVVFGVGTASTVAAWTDTEAASSSFAASVFDTQSQTAGTPEFASHPAGSAASLVFTGGALHPGAVAHAWINVRTSPASTVGGTVVLSGVSSSEPPPPVTTPVTPLVASALEYRIVRLPGLAPGSACGAAAFGGANPFVAGSGAGYLPVLQTPPSGVTPTPLGPAGAGIGFCVEVRMSPEAANSLQGRSATVTWTFTGTSSG